MEKLYKIVPIGYLTLFFRRARTEKMNNNILWRIVCGFFISIAAVIGIVAYLMYNQVAMDPLLPPSPTIEQPAVSMEELNEVINLYQKKEANQQFLRQNPPQAPLLQLGSGRSNAN